VFGWKNIFLLVDSDKCLRVPDILHPNLLDPIEGVICLDYHVNFYTRTQAQEQHALMYLLAEVAIYTTNVGLVTAQKLGFSVTRHEPRSDMLSTWIPQCDKFYWTWKIHLVKLIK
jgi:hypothetical protein